MLTMGELVICGAILTLAFMAMLVVFIKNAVEQNTNVPNLLLSILKKITRKNIIRKSSKAPEENGATEKNQETWEKGETMSGETKTETETEPKNNKYAPGLLASLTSAMFQWQPKNLFGKKNDKQKEMSKYIDSELEKLLAESALEEHESNPIEYHTASPSDEMNMINAEREARLKELFKNGEANWQPDAANKAGKAPGMSQDKEIKVEKIQIQEGKTPNWGDIVPKKDPSQLLKDAEAMAPIAGMLEADIPAEGKAMDRAPAMAIDSDGQLRINDMPIWGHTELGKPLDKFKPDNEKQGPSAPNERLSMDLQINSERSEMKNAAESKPSIMPETAKPTLAAVTATALVSAKSGGSSGIDFSNDILAELKEDMKEEDDVSMDIMGDLKGTHINVQELTLDSMEVLSRFNTNVKSNKKAKKKTRPKV